MKSYISLLLLCLAVQLGWAQGTGGDYNPVNPADPDTYYQLTVSAAPKRGGYVSTSSSGGMLTAGANVRCSAEARSGYTFLRWMEGETVVSEESSFTYTMPDRNVALVAFFEKQVGGYNPDSPVDPNQKGYTHTVSLYANPSAAGSFNAAKFELTEGDSARVYAWPSNGYRFEAWMKDGKVYSVNNPLTVVMGTAPQAYTAQFTYNPENPSDPNANVFNVSTGELIIDHFTQGQLSSVISQAMSDNDYSSVQSVIVSGRMNADDWGVTRYFSACTSIDLSRTSEYAEVPAWAFEDAKTLTTVTLPGCVQTIGRNAFDGCTQLSVLACYALMPPTLEAQAFGGVKGLVVKVPASAQTLYRKAEGWKNFTIQPLDEQTSDITLQLPTDAADGRYDNMYIELYNTANGQTFRYLIANGQTTYTFVGLLRDCSYTATVKTASGTVLGQLSDVALGKDNVKLTFNRLLQPQKVSLHLTTTTGATLDPSLYTVTWTDASGHYIGQGCDLGGMVEGNILNYKVRLNSQLEETCRPMADGTYTVQSADNVIVMPLVKKSEVTLTGLVKDATTGNPLQNAVVAVSQALTGKQAKTTVCRTGADGHFTAVVVEGSGQVTVSADNYITQSIKCDNLDATLPDVLLKALTGARIQLSFTYTESVSADSAVQVLGGYADADNIAYTLYNKTKGIGINAFTVQNSAIVLQNTVDEGDEIVITAHSKKAQFGDVQASCIIDALNRAKAQIDLVQYGALKASIIRTDNNAYTGMLYGHDGAFVAKGAYRNGMLSMTGLADGHYTLVTMINSRFFSAVGSMEGFKAAGLINGTDYVAAEVDVEKGRIAELTIPAVPAFDESRFYYTDESGTSFIANKASVMTGSYVTLRGQVVFKPECADRVRGAYLVVDLPQSCMFVPNSVLTGSGKASYTLEGSTLSIPLEGTDHNVRFCVIPLEGGDMTPHASVQFECDNEQFVQPIGAAYFRAVMLNLNAPEKTAVSTVTVSGTAPSNQLVKVYDNGVSVGQTYSAANGYWALRFPLVKPYTRSMHQIYGETTTNDGSRLLTVTSTVDYDRRYNALQKTYMIYNGTTIVFDQEQGKTSSNTYSYNPSVTDFTFIADFINNDTTAVSNVVFKVLASDGTVRSVNARYSDVRQQWVARAVYGSSYKLPVNVTVEYESPVSSSFVLDKERAADEKEYVLQVCDNFAKSIKEENVNLTRDETNVLATTYTRDDGQTITTEITPLDCNNLPFDKASGEQISVDGNNFSIKNDEVDGGFNIYLWDNDMAVKMAFFWSSDDEVKKQARTLGNLLSKADATWLYNPYSWVSNFLGYGDYMKGTDNYTYWVNNYTKCVDEHIVLSQRIKNLILAKCSDGTDKLTQLQKELFAISLNLFNDMCSDMEADYLKNLKSYRNSLLWGFARTSALNLFTAGLSSKLAGSKLLGKELKPNVFEFNKIGKWLLEKCAPLAGVNARHAYDFLSATAADEIVKRIEGGIDESITSEKEFDVSDGADCMDAWYFKASMKLAKEYRNLYNRIENAYARCPKKKEKEDEKEENDMGQVTYVCPPLKPSVDPSGYVYECVPSNRLEGVTASIYYKETVEDMYGETHEKVVLWDASEYAQENPLYTDAQGMYAWDVPQGLWQVKLEKEGYETAYSEWLPVPPPQLDVNIGMVQNSQPAVKAVHAYENGVEIAFSKYMQPATLTTEHITVTADGHLVEGTVELLDAENGGNGRRYASRVRFVPAESITAHTVLLTVSNRVKSYAGVNMQEVYCQEFAVEQQLHAFRADSVLNLTVGSEYDLSVRILPAAAAMGKVLTLGSRSPQVVDLSDLRPAVDADGMAHVTVRALLPGTAVLEYHVEGYSLVGETMVNVFDDRQQMADAPVPSVVTGSVVDKGTEVALTCATEGAVIYYTLDGSCPCENSPSRKCYDGNPISIQDNTQIRAIACADDLYESEVVTFFYTVADASGIEGAMVHLAKVYPSVVKRTVNVNIQNGHTCRVVVTDMVGRQVYAADNVTGHCAVDLSGQQTGLYVVAVCDDRSQYAVKVLKTR